MPTSPATRSDRSPAQLITMPVSKEKASPFGSFTVISYPEAFFSIFAARIDDKQQYSEFMGSYRKHKGKFSKPLNILLKKYSDLKINADYLIAEKLMTGQQVTLEGYVYNGKIEIMGITDSIMYPI